MAVHFCICVSANTNQTICIQELDSTSDTVNLKVSLMDQLEQLKLPWIATMDL